MDIENDFSYNKHSFKPLYKKIIIKEAFRKVMICKSLDKNLVVECFENRKHRYNFVLNDNIAIKSPSNESIGKNENFENYLKIYIPDGFIVDIIIKNKKSLINIDEIFAHKIRILSYDCEVKCSKVIAHSIDVIAKVSTVYMFNIFATLDINVRNTVGTIVMKNIDFAHTLNIKNYGKVELGLENKIDNYKFSLKSVKGIVQVNEKDYEKNKFNLKKKIVKIMTMNDDINVYCNE